MTTRPEGEWTCRTCGDSFMSEPTPTRVCASCARDAEDRKEGAMRFSEGDTFLLREERGWHAGDERGTHRFLLLMVVTSVDDDGFEYIHADTLEESGRPPFVVGPPVARGSCLHVAVDDMVKRRQIIKPKPSGHTMTITLDVREAHLLALATETLYDANGDEECKALDAKVEAVWSKLREVEADYLREVAR